MRILRKNIPQITEGDPGYFGEKDDTATPPFTGEKIASLIQNSKFYLLDGDHYFFINHKDFIAGELMGELNMELDGSLGSR